MKSTRTKIALLLVVVILIVACLVACNNTNTFKVTIMDGEREVATFDVNANTTMSKDEVIAKLNKAGYEFVGLYTDAELSTAFVFENEVSSATTLYAKYTQKQLYISVKSEEGMSTVEKIPVSTGATYTVPTPTKEGWTFTGYTYLDEEENEVAFPQNGTYSFTENTRLTAHWTKNVYSVKFHVGDTVTEQSVEHGKTAVLTPATMTGYTFVDWRLDGATTAFAATTAITANTDLYAYFTPNTYTVTFDPDLGLQAYTATYGAAYTLTEPTKAGKTFAGFKKDGAAFATSGTYTVAGDIYLTGVWTDLTYDVTFLAADDTQLAKQTGLLYNAKAQAISVIGNSVQGYYLDKNFAEEITLSEYAITANTTVYVKTEANLYTLTVDSWHEATIEVRYGETYTLIAPTDTTNPIYVAKVGTGADNEWATFTGYTYENGTFATTGTYNWAENITVYPVYTANEAYGKATVTFRDTLENKAFKAETVVRGETVVADNFPNATKVGYKFLGWFTTADWQIGTEFNASTPVNANLTAYAKYAAHNWTLTIKDTNAEGAVLQTIPVTYGSAFELPNSIAKTGYTFVAYSEAVASPYAIDEDKTIFATFTRNTVTVTFMPAALDIEAKQGYQYDALSTFLPATNPEKAGYTFKWWSLTDGGAKADYTAEVGENKSIYAVFEANKYTITYDGGSLQVTYEQAYELPASLTKAGYTFVKYTYNNADFAATGTYAIADDITLVVVWQLEEGANFVSDSVNGYFKERPNAESAYTYVFLAGRTYNFPGYTITSTSDKIAISNNVSFVANAIGDFSFTATNTTSHLANTINAKIVYDVRSISIAGDYASMIAMAGNSNNFQKTTSEEDYVISAGVDNFIPEISILDANLTARTLEEANVSITVGDNVMNYTLDGTAVNFASSYAGSEAMTLTFKPKYAFGNTAVTLKVQLNNGVNVYTNAQLKANYANTDVHSINVLRNIKAELDESDYVSGYGTTGNIVLKYQNGDMTQTVTLENRDLGTPKNWFGGGVYTRTTRKQDDNVVINGNYFSIDGTKLPYVDDALNRTSGAGYDLSDVQIGIFLYRCAELDSSYSPTSTDRDDMTGVKYATGTITMNNLRIEGNNIPQYAAATADPLPDCTLPYLKMSASYNGIIVRGGTLNLNNTTITNVNLGMMLHGGVSGYYKPGWDANRGGAADGQARDEGGQATVLVMKDSMINNCWTSSIYNFDLVNLTLQNTKLGSSAAAAIHFDDRPYGGNAEGSLGYSNLNSELTMDTYTVAHINNWVAGTEPWFVAYAQTGTATKIKEELEAGAQIFNPYASILRNINNVEMMNFGIVVFPTATDKAAAWAADKDGKAKVDIHGLDAEFGFGFGPVFFYVEDDLSEVENEYWTSFVSAYNANPTCYNSYYMPYAQLAMAVASGDKAAIYSAATSEDLYPYLAGIGGALTNNTGMIAGGADGITVYIPVYYVPAS